MIHTQVAGEGLVTDGDPSETLVSISDVGHVDDFTGDVPPINSRNSFSEQSEEWKPNELSRVNCSTVRSTKFGF